MKKYATIAGLEVATPSSQLWQEYQAHEGEPEEAVGRESRGSKGIVLLLFHQTCKYLGDSSVEYSHGQDLSKEKRTEIQ